MIKKWMELFSKGTKEIKITIEKEASKKSVLDLMKPVKNAPLKQESTNDLTNDLMNGLMKFRNETASLDYLRNEIEEVLHEKDGEIKLMEGFAKAMKQNKK